MTVILVVEREWQRLLRQQVSVHQVCVNQRLHHLDPPADHPLGRSPSLEIVFLGKLDEPGAGLPVLTSLD
jgi:hypothetical protein